MNKIRCAIYTRKSSEVGLEQEFNSLDAQREACVAYITSQKHEGWVLLPEHYDDGGLSGGLLERPAKQPLLQHTEDGLVDQIIVNKIDRLTCSDHSIMQKMALLRLNEFATALRIKARIRASGALKMAGSLRLLSIDIEC